MSIKQLNSKGRFMIYIDWYCLHWPSVHRGGRDERGHEYPDDLEILLGPLHIFFFQKGVV